MVSFPTDDRKKAKHHNFLAWFVKANFMKKYSFIQKKKIKYEKTSRINYAVYFLQIIWYVSREIY